MFLDDNVPEQLFQLALKLEGSPGEALSALARTGKIAETYLGPFVNHSLACCVNGFDNSIRAKETVPCDQ